MNPHNTCYLNVLLQSLFRVWPFRKVLQVFLRRVIARMSVKAADRSSVLYMLQKVFAEMTLSKDLSYFPDGLLRTMMINTDVQCDSHEFFDHLMASLKSDLESQGDKSAVVSLFASPVTRRPPSTSSSPASACCAAAASTAARFSTAPTPSPSSFPRFHGLRGRTARW